MSDVIPLPYTITYTPPVYGLTSITLGTHIPAGPTALACEALSMRGMVSKQTYGRPDTHAFRLLSGAVLQWEGHDRPVKVSTAAAHPNTESRHPLDTSSLT